MAQVLKLPAYRRLLAAYGLTEIAWTIVSLALALLVYRRTGSALGAALFFICAQFIPAFLSPAVVARVDRLPPRHVLSALYVLEAGLFLLLAWAVSHLAVGFVLGLALVDGVIALVVRSLARTATVGVTAPAGLLREGNALTNTVFSISLMAGPALGGVIVSVASVRVALLSASGIILAIALMLATARGLPEAMVEQTPVTGRLRAAIRYVADQRLIRALLALQSIGLIFFTMSIPVEVVLAEHTLRSGAGGYGALLTAWGAGAIAGSAIFARWRRQSAWVLIAVGTGCAGIGFGVMAIAPSLAVAAVGAAIAGNGNGVEAVAVRTALQEQVKPEWMAVVTSLNESISQGLPGVGILLGGAAAQLDGARFAFAIAAAAALVITVGVCALLRGLSTATSSQGSLEAPPVAPLTFAAQHEQPR